MHDTICHLRAMRSADLDALLGVQAACYSPSMREPAAVLLARMQIAGDTCVVAEDGHGVCGYLFAYPSRLGSVTPLDGRFEIAPGADTLYLHDLSVAPRAHRRGLARALAGHVLALGGRRGLHASALVAVQDSAGFWAGLGYRATGLACPAARAALATYPGGARYMTRALTGSGAPWPSCSCRPLSGTGCRTGCARS